MRFGNFLRSTSCLYLGCKMFTSTLFYEWCQIIAVITHHKNADKVMRMTQTLARTTTQPAFVPIILPDNRPFNQFNIVF